jgi:hypothetical protein
LSNVVTNHQRNFPTQQTTCGVDILNGRLHAQNSSLSACSS